MSFKYTNNIAKMKNTELKLQPICFHLNINLFLLGKQKHVVRGCSLDRLADNGHIFVCFFFRFYYQRLFVKLLSSSSWSEFVVVVFCCCENGDCPFRLALIQRH